MTDLGDMEVDRQAQVVATFNRAMALAVQGGTPEFLKRIDVADVRTEVLAGVTERLRYAGMAFRFEGRFLVMGR